MGNRWKQKQVVAKGTLRALGPRDASFSSAGRHKLVVLWFLKPTNEMAPGTQNFSFLPSRGVRRGILIAASANHFRLISSRRSKNTLRLQMLDDVMEWHLTGGIWATSRAEQSSLPWGVEVYQTKHTRGIPHDFNMIYSDQDKNKSWVNSNQR
jgi:hypothetical protein